jgi:hypothetical protein
MEVSGQLHVPAAPPPGKETLDRSLDGPQSLFGRDSENKISFSFRESNPVQPVA